MRPASLMELCRAARRDGRKLLSVYLTAGFPNREWTLPLAVAGFGAGVDFIELGIPFSDPLADGPTIQRASAISLQNRTTLSDVFDMARAMSVIGPILLMGYFNSVAVHGRERFLDRAAQCGASGLIIADLPPDEEPEFHEQAGERSLPIIPFTAPTTPSERILQLDQLGAPFIYAVSLTGVTGARKALPSEAIAYVKRVRSLCHTPVLAGFGIGSSETARALIGHVDGVIVGSALIERIAQAETSDAACAAVSKFITELREAVDQEVSTSCW